MPSSEPSVKPSVDLASKVSSVGVADSNGTSSDENGTEKFEISKNFAHGFSSHVDMEDGLIQDEVDSGHLEVVGQDTVDSGHLEVVGQDSVDSGHLEAVGKDTVDSGHLEVVGHDSMEHESSEHVESGHENKPKEEEHKEDTSLEPSETGRNEDPGQKSKARKRSDVSGPKGTKHHRKTARRSMKSKDKPKDDLEHMKQNGSEHARERVQKVRHNRKRKHRDLEHIEGEGMDSKHIGGRGHKGPGPIERKRHKVSGHTGKKGQTYSEHSSTEDSSQDQQDLGQSEDEITDRTHSVPARPEPPRKPNPQQSKLVLSDSYQLHSDDEDSAEDMATSLPERSDSPPAVTRKRKYPQSVPTKLRRGKRPPFI